LLANYSVNPDLAKSLAESLTSGTPDLATILDGEVADEQLDELITQLQGVLPASNISPKTSPAAVDTFTKFILQDQFSVGDFHKLEACALQKSSILQMVGTICDNFPNPKQIFSVLFYLIKRGQGLSSLATTLKQEFISRSMNNEFSLRFFINVLLLNCGSFLRHKVIDLLAISNPIPLNEYTLENGAFSLALIPEPYWVLDDKFVLLSYGLDICKGKSTILNQIFGTTFEESDGTLYFQGTVDMQSDKMFIQPRDITVLDSHGTLSKLDKHALLTVADGVIIHVSDRLWMDTKQLFRNRLPCSLQIEVYPCVGA
jgi:hypothetical protein